MKAFRFIIALVSVLAWFAGDVSLARAAAKKIVLVAGRASHGTGAHEFNAGVQLLHKCLQNVPGISSTFVLNGWPQDEKVFEGAATIVFFMDGGAGHPVVQGERLKLIGDLVKKGVGIGCIHYAVEVPKERGGAEFLDWIGGYFEMHWSVNPHWDAEFKEIPKHPITQGVKPFKINDEWYYHMRFRENMQGVTPILTAIPPESTLNRPDGPHSGNPHVRAKKGMPQHVAWAYERPDGGRGFGFTGAHFHRNWGDENFRKVVLNAIVWTAKADVPPNGVACALTDADLRANLDPKGK